MDVEQLLRSNFTDRAEAVDRPRSDLHDTVLAGYRHARRTRALVVAGVLAVALLVGGVPWLRDHVAGEVARPDPAPTTVPAAPTALLYDVPTRGSLAGDADELERIRQLSWDTGAPADPGPRIDPAADTRRVLFAGEVPGGQLWALVEGVFDERYYYAWFADVGTDDGPSLGLVRGPVQDEGARAMSLLDVTGDSGPLLVVALPGDRIVATTDPAGAVHGPQGSTERELPVEDGVAGALVDTADETLSHGVQVFQGDELVAAPSPLQFFSSGPARPLGGPPPSDQYAVLMTPCLDDRGFVVTVEGSTFSYLSSSPEEQKAFDVAVHECAYALGYE